MKYVWLYYSTTFPGFFVGNSDIFGQNFPFFLSTMALTRHRTWVFFAAKKIKSESFYDILVCVYSEHLLRNQGV